MNPRIITGCLLLSCAIAHAEQAPITIDGCLDDWNTIEAAWEDARGDGAGAIDFLGLRLADDERFLFLRLEAAEDLDLSENNELRLYLDTDMNVATGLAVGAIGAELEWRAGDRFGTFFVDGQPATTVSQVDIRFRGAPTVTDTAFEIGIGRDTRPDGVNLLFTGPQIRVLITDDVSGDMMPDAGMTLTYTLDVGVAPPVVPRSLARRNPNDLRILTHNVLNDRPFNPAFAPAFNRLYNAVRPDVLHLQEVSNHSGAETRDLITGWLDGDWHVASVADCKTVSRYPILGSWAIDGNVAALIDTTAAIGTPMLSINAHLPCCGNDAGRQAEADAIIEFIRDAYQAMPELGPDTPVMIAGDLNLVGLAQQLETLLTGDIQDEDAHGSDHAPDPDGTPLTSLISRQTEKRMGYTWRNDGESFWPGHLDFFVFSDSNLAVAHDFVVYTPEMSDASLLEYDLLAGDSLVSDHLVLCADFARPCVADLDRNGTVGFSDLLALLTNWGPCRCRADLDGSGAVDFADLLVLLSSWGDC